MESVFVMQILAGHDGSPVSKALLDSCYGDSLVTEIENGFYTTLATFGLSGVKEGKEDKVADVVLDVIGDIADNGTSQENIDAAVMAVDFSNREVVRASGPYSLELLNRTATSWNYGTHPAMMLGYRAAFEKVKERLAADSSYVQKLVRRLFIDNAARAFVVVTPSSEYNSLRTEKEKSMIRELCEQTSEAQIKERQEQLRQYQYREETSEEAGCIPHIQPKDISAERPPIVTFRESCAGADGSQVQAFFNSEPTNGIVYFDVAFPVDTLLPEDYFYLPLLCVCMFNSGWSGKDWAACMVEASLCAGDMSAYVFTASTSTTERAALLAKSAAEFNYVGRDWFVCRMKLPVEKAEEAFALFSQAICGTDFSDVTRIRNLTDDYCNGAREAVVPGASKFMNSRTVCRMSRACAVDEIWRGLSQVLSLKKIAKEKSEKLSARFRDLLQKIISNGAVVHVTADADSLEKVKPYVKNFVAGTKLRSLCPLVERAGRAFFDLTSLRGLRSDLRFEAVQCDTQVGCASAAFLLGDLSVKEKAALEVFGHWLSANGLWAHIRTAGGAYGAFAELNTRNKFFRLFTYRDPQPERSLEEFSVCINEACAADLSTEDVERAVTGTYGDLVFPLSPYARGMIGFKRNLYAVSEEDVLDLRRALLQITKKDIKEAAQNICQKLSEMQAAVTVSKKSAKPRNCLVLKL